MKTLDFLHLSDKNIIQVIDALQQLLADYQVFYTNLRDFHWNIKGHGFFTLHAKFEEIYNDAATKIDEIAERILMLGGTPENRFSKYLDSAKIKETTDIKCGTDAIDNILDSLGYIIQEERRLTAIADLADDVVTIDMLTGYLAQQEKLVWMLVAFRTQSCHK